MYHCSFTSQVVRQLDVAGTDGVEQLLLDPGAEALPGDSDHRTRRGRRFPPSAMWRQRRCTPVVARGIATQSGAARAPTAGRTIWSRSSLDLGAIEDYRLHETVGCQFRYGRPCGLRQRQDTSRRNAAQGNTASILLSVNSDALPVILWHCLLQASVEPPHLPIICLTIDAHWSRVAGRPRVLTGVLLICLVKMVLQERIELSTSPLPRECSTTELLQHPGRTGDRRERGV